MTAFEEAEHAESHLQMLINRVAVVIAAVWLAIALGCLLKISPFPLIQFLHCCVLLPGYHLRERRGNIRK